MHGISDVQVGSETEIEYAKVERELAGHNLGNEGVLDSSLYL